MVTAVISRRDGADRRYLSVPVLFNSLLKYIFRNDIMAIDTPVAQYIFYDPVQFIFRKNERKVREMIKKDPNLASYFNDENGTFDTVEIKRVDNKLEITPIPNEPIHISEIRFHNDSWFTASFEFEFIYTEWNGSTYTSKMESTNMYKGKVKILTFNNVSPDARGNFCPTVENSIRVYTAFFNYETNGQKWILDPNANLRAKYRATGPIFNPSLHFDGTEQVSPPVPPGAGDLKLVNTCGVSTEQGLLQQVIIKENGNNYFSKTWDTHNADSVYHVGLKKGANYAIQMREVYNLSPPREIPAYVYINAYINIQNCQAHDGTIKLIGTGFPTGKEDYTFDYNGKHYTYTQTLNIQDA